MIEKYAFIHRLLHWTIAIGIIGLIAVGLYMEGLPDDHPNKYELYGLHKSFGVTVLGLAVLRVISRILTYIPPMPKGLSIVEKIAASAVHGLLYLAMFAMPISGVVMSNAAGYGVKLFSIELPRVIEKNVEIGKVAHMLHQYGAYVLIALIALHFLGAMKHRFFDKENDVLPRML